MKRFTLYVLLLCLFLTAFAYANITIDGDSVHVETDSYVVNLGNGVIDYIHNKRTGETYTIPTSSTTAAQTGILRWGADPIWASSSPTDARQSSKNSATMLFRQGENEVVLTIEIEAMTGDLLIGGHGVSEASDVYAFQWGCDNIDINSVGLILPARGGQIITASSPLAMNRYDYPGLWEAQLAILQGKQGGFFVRGTDKTFQFKRFTCEKNSEEIALGFQTHNQAPWDSLKTVQSVTWRFNTYAGDYRVPASIYRYWMEDAFDPWRLSDVPSWVEGIGLVVTSGVSRTRLERLYRLAEHVDPSKTLVYVVNWRKDRHDVNYPDYTPKDGFEDYLKAAHGLGYRIMLHANSVGVSPYHPLYAKVQRFQFRSPWDGASLIGWRWNETDNPKRHAWINNASPEFREILVSRLKAVWEEFPVDAFHLDINIVENDANGLIEGLNSAQGSVLMYKQLEKAMPGVVFSGEYLQEVAFFRASFAQRFPLPQESTPHPISSFLFSPYTRVYGHLGIATASIEPARYQEFLDSYEHWGVLPTLQGGDLQQPDHPLVQQVLGVARQWQEFGLRPDFESNWGADTLFQYITDDGEPVIYQQTPEGVRLFLDIFPDLNNDGVINVLDLVIVSNRFGTPDGDLNGDGTTNILDLVVIARHIEKSK